jgi:RHS repeat-associated protein
MLARRGQVAAWVTVPHWGQPTSIVETGDLPYSRTTTITYDQLTEPLSDKPHTIAVSGNGETYTTEVVQHFPTNGWVPSKTAYGITTNYYPDQYGNVWYEIDGNGHRTTYTYNWGVVASVQTPEFTVTYDINRDSTVNWVERRGKRTNYHYVSGRLTEIDPPLGNATTFTYGADGRSVATTRGPSTVTTLFDEFGRTAGSIDAAGATTRTVLDEWGRPVYQGHPYLGADDHKGMTTEYDVLGRITKATNPDNTVRTWSYDGQDVTVPGQQVTITDENGHSTVQVWQACGAPASAQLAKETVTPNATDPPQITTYGYNLLGQLVRITSPDGKVRQWTYFTGTDRLQSVTIPESGTQSWTYDLAGLVASTTDANQNVTTYEYDGNNRLRFVRSWDPNYTAEMRYDESDNRVWMHNAYATTTFEYDDGNRLRKRTDVIDGRSFDTVYTPDDNDRLVDVQYPSGNHVSYDYDDVNDHGRLSRVYDDRRGMVFAHNFIYHPAGAITSYVSGNGITNTIEFDETTYRPKSATSTGGALNLNYHYDPVGNVDTVTDTRLGTATFGYDDIDRLTTALLPWAKIQYGYAPLGGNRSSVTRNDVNTTNYNYDPVTNRLSGTTGSQVETIDHYATSGLVKADRFVSNYAYTPNDLVETAANRNGASYIYRYNPDDERVLKTTASGDPRTYVVNGLSEFSTDGGPITWTVDYLYIGSRLLGAVRPAPGSVYTLTVTKPGNGAGRVSGLPAGLDCGPECTARYVSGTRVTLTATAETGSYFTGWGGACSGTTTTVDVTIDAVKTCTATFVSNKLTVTLAGSGTGTVSASGLICQGTQCTGVYPLQTAVTLVATPGTGSAFAGWSGDAGCGGSVTMTAALHCTATFTLTTSSYTLTVVKTGEGSAGSVVTSNPAGISCGATCAASFISGTPVQLTATPATGYELAFWQGDGCTTGTVTMTGPRTCTAWFQPIVPPCNPTPAQLQVCRSSGGRWDSEMCACRRGALDPLVLTLDGSPIPLTDLPGGVLFDVEGDGALEHVAWTAAGSSAGWLVLDLDGDGAITTGAELLGTMVGRPRHARPVNGDNSFTLLAAYDDPANGGNGDGIISAADAVFGQLRLWIDRNHDGVSQPDELVPLDTAGVVSIELSYQITRRRDGVGNVYRYRGTVHLASGRSVPIWDVFLATADAAPPQVAALEQRGLRAAVGHSLRQVGAWVRRALAPRTVSALTGIRSVRAPRSSAKSTTWWPTDSGPLAQGGPASAGEAEPGDENSAPAVLQDPPPPPTQVVEYYHLDLLGSVRAVTDEQGLVIARHDFEPFGEEVSPQSPPKDRRLFTGQERDFETGLDYFNARQYRPDLGQFTAPDPLSADPTAGPLSSYTYVDNNPLAYVDPTGLQGQSGITFNFSSGSFGFDFFGGGPWISGFPTSQLAAFSPSYAQMTPAEVDWLSSGWVAGHLTQPDAGLLSLRTEKGMMWANPTGQRMRGCDKGGCGQFGARRDEGLGKNHMGADYLAGPGQPVVAVAFGKITALGYAYRGNRSLAWMDIQTWDDYVVGIGYVALAPGLGKGSVVWPGQVIGTAQDVRVVPALVNCSPHVHIQIYRRGKFVDPATLIPRR